jgi:thiamine kinase-like enzyme
MRDLIAKYKILYNYYFSHFLLFVSLPLKKKISAIWVRISMLKSLFLNSNRVLSISINDLNSYHKCNLFLDEARKLHDKALSDEIIYKITHCRSLIGIKNNNFRLKRLRMAGGSYESIIDYINQFDLFRELTHEFISYEGRKSLGLIIHRSNKPILITKIIKTEEEFFRESQFYEKLRMLGELETVTPGMVFKSKFRNIFLITLEYIDSEEEHTVTPEKVLTALNVLERVNTRSFPDLSKNNQLAVESDIFNYRRIIREFYKMLYIFSENSMINLKLIQWAPKYLRNLKTEVLNLVLVHGDSLSWNFKVSGNKVKIIDWETFYLGLPGSDYIDFIIKNSFDVKFIIYFFTNKLANCDEQFINLLMLFVVKSVPLLLYMNQCKLNASEKSSVLNSIMERLNESYWKKINSFK